MTKKSASPPKSKRGARALAVALEDNKDVKVRVEGAASDLAASSAVLKTKIAGGNPEVAARDALKVGEEVKGKVEECADDLHSVNETLAQGVIALERTENALATAQASLKVTKYALAEAKKSELEALHASRHDSATGLANREHFNSRLAHDIAVVDRHGFDLAVMFIDLNKFKSINDTHGHAAGDEILKQVAIRLLANCRLEDTVCRTGGDEFLYVLIDPKGRNNIERIASALMKAIAVPVEFDGTHLVVRPSIGISLYPDDGQTASELISSADAAMYAAKKGIGGPGWAFHDTGMLHA